MGLCYEKGKGCEQNLNKAFELYEEAVDKGNIGGFLKFWWR